MKVKYNNQEIQKINYNGRYFDKVKYNGTIYCFGSYNEQSLQSFQNRPTILASINNAELVANLYNGNVKVSIPDVTFGNSSLGIGVGHIYNSMMDNDEIYAAKWTFMGKGFKINYQQYLIKVNEQLYYYIDGLGVKHEIVPAIRGNTFYDTSGLGLILSEDDTSSLILTDRSDNKMYFNKDTGFIIKIVNCLGHITSMEYDNMRLIKVTRTVLSKSRTMNFAYDSLDRLKTISYEGSDKIIVYNYKLDSNLLETITKKSMQKEELLVKFEYDSNNKIQTIINLENQSIKLFYIDNKIDIIQEGVIVNNNFEVLRIQNITYTLIILKSLLN